MSNDEEVLEASVERDALETTLDHPFSASGLKKKVFAAFSWSFVGFVFTQIFRFASNLILTRLFLPEAFGIMQLITAFLQGVAMFSDFGIQVNIVQHKDGGDTAFLRTAWTIQILRGLLIQIFFICLAIPFAEIYHIPELKWLIPLAGLTAIIDGLCSTNLVILIRNMKIRQLAFLDLFSQLAGIVIMIFVAWHIRSVWTLLIAGFVSSLIKLGYSHLCLQGPTMKWELKKEYLYEILHFGKWIFVSSICGFLLSRVDRLILGLYISITDLGLYGIAYALGMLMFELMLSISNRVLIPLYSHFWRERKSQLKNLTFKVRVFLMLMTFLIMFPIMIWSHTIIQFFYPPSYWEAGWMLRVLAIGCCFKCIMNTSSAILLAAGDSFKMMSLLIFSSIVFIISLTFGGHFWGVTGAIWAIPISEIISYFFLVWVIYPFGVWLPLLDLLGFILTVVVGILAMTIYNY